MRPLVALLAACAVLFGTQTGEAQPRPANEQPMYGEVAKTPDMLAADKAFIDQVEGMGYSRAGGSDESVKRGMQELMQKHDLTIAMRRFNQAWLLDPDNGDAYHGMAIVVMERDHDPNAADRLFRMALAAPRKSPNIGVDYGRLLLMSGRPRDAVPVLEETVRKPDVSPDGPALLALAFRDLGDFQKACTAAQKAQPIAQPPLKTWIDQIVSDPKCR